MKTLALALFFIAQSGFCYAQSTPFRLTYTPEKNAIPKGHRSLEGFELGFMAGSETNNTGLQIGYIMSESVGLDGVSIAAVNFCGRLRGLQLGGTNISTDAFKGAQIGLFNINGDRVLVNWKGTGESAGLMLGGINMNTGMPIRGVVVGIINNQAAVHGLQMGALNFAGDMHGIQIGVFNKSKALHGVQIGLVNWNQSGHGLDRVLPLFNAGF